MEIFELFRPTYETNASSLCFIIRAAGSYVKLILLQFFILIMYDFMFERKNICIQPSMSLKYYSGVYQNCTFILWPLANSPAKMLINATMGAPARDNVDLYFIHITAYQALVP